MKVVKVAGIGEQQLKVAIKNLSGKVGKVGWFKGAKYENGQQVAYIAAIQEMGYPAKNIPPRPFLRTTIGSKKQNWSKIAEKYSKLVIKGEASIDDVFNIIGQQAVFDVKKTISQIFDPPLKPSTIKSRMRKYKDKKTVGNLTKPLVDTGQMIATIINIVEDE